MNYRSIVVNFSFSALLCSNIFAYPNARPSTVESPPQHNRPLSEYLDSGLEANEHTTGSGALGASRIGALLGPGFSSNDGWNPPSRGSEFISGYYRGAVLMPVRLWGAVRQAGLHQVPTGTDLMQLITLAGGPNPDAEMEDVVIKRMAKEGPKVIKVNLTELISSADRQPIELEANDTVIIPSTKPFIDQNTLTFIGVVTSVVGIVASSVLIANQVK